MAITIDWPTKIINVPRNDMILIQSNPVEIRQLNINDFRLILKDLEDSVEGMPYVDTHSHVAPVSVGGVQLARVVEIINDYTVTFEDGQYAVNLVGANSNIADRTNVNQVSVRSANSAGLPNLEVLETAAFNGAVHLKANSGYSGTAYPVGTPGYPVDNVPDARLIAAQQQIGSLKIIGNYTLDTGDDISFFKVYGQNAIQTQLVVNEGAKTEGAQIVDVTLSGNLDGGTLVERSVINAVNYVNGFIYRCMLAPGTITLGGTNPAYFLDCYSGVPGIETPTIDMNGAGDQDTPLAIRNYTGGIKLIQKTGTGKASIDIGSGQVIVDSSCVAGQIVVRGDSKVVDENGNLLLTGTINTALDFYNETTPSIEMRQVWTTMGLNPSQPAEELSVENLVDKMWDEPLSSHTTPGTFGKLIQSKLLTVSKFLGLR